MTLPKASRILIIKTQAIGDLLMTTPAIRDLRAAYPAAHLTLMTGAWSAPVMRQNPHLDEVLEFEDRILLDRRWRGIWRLLKQVRRQGFDAAVIFHPSPFLHLFALLAGIPLRFGLRRTKARNLFLTAAVEEDLGLDTYYPVNFQRVVALLGATTGNSELDVHEAPGDSERIQRQLALLGISAEEEFVLVAPGGGRNSKEDVAARRWPVENFAKLMEKLRKEQPLLRIVLTGAEGDKYETGFLARKVPEAIDLTAKTTLTELFALVRRSRAVVCNDSAILHIGVACQKPVIVPFGPTGARQRLPGWALQHAVQSTLPCSPCYVGGAFPGCPIGFQCMREMDAETLYGRLAEALIS